LQDCKERSSMVPKTACAVYLFNHHQKLCECCFYISAHEQ
jgi:hypothetical protein